MNNAVIQNPQMMYPNYQMQQMQNPLPALPDDSDRVSSVVGYNVNNYVWGNGQPQQLNNFGYQNPAMQPVCPQTPQNKLSNSAFGGLILTGLVAGGAVILGKLTGRCPSFQDIKNAIGSFIHRTHP